jgi:hypothetical protein
VPTTPAWLGATSGSNPVAGQINQFLGAHQVQYLYAGTLKTSQATNGSAHTSGSATLYIAQSFTTAAGQTTIGYVSVPVDSFTASGSTLGTTTLSLYANSSSAPTGSPLLSTTLTTEYAYLGSNSGSSDNVSLIYPLPVTGLTASTEYWLVLSPAGNGTNHYTWRQSNQTSGASTSTNGTSWTAQTYGLQYAVYDQTASGLLTATWEDSGARWTALTYNSLSQISTLAEYTTGQTAAGYTQSYRTLSYSNAQVTKVV